MSHLVIDYGADHPLLFVVTWDDDGTIWCVPQDKLRFQKNITYHRPPQLTVDLF